MAHFKISLAGQLHFAPQAGDWSFLFVLVLVVGAESETSHPTHLVPTIHPQKDIVA